VGGGSVNRLRNGANNSTIGGGNENLMRSIEGTIAGGVQNTVGLNARASSIVGNESVFGGISDIFPDNLSPLSLPSATR
jgi:hypothetical protein